MLFPVVNFLKYVVTEVILFSNSLYDTWYRISQGSVATRGVVGFLVTVLPVVFWFRKSFNVW